MSPDQPRPREAPEPGPAGSGPRDAAGAVAWPVRVAAAWTWRLLLLGAGIYVLARVLVRIELVAFSFVLSLFLVAILHPLEARLRRAVPRPRSLAAVVTLLVGVAVLGGIGYFVVWQITDHASQLNQQLTHLVDSTRNWLRTGPLHLKSSDLDKLAENITSALKAHQGQLITGAIETVRTVVEFLTAFLLILLSTFFLLRDGDAVWRWTVRLFPRGVHDPLDRAGRVGWHSLGGYMRGQLVIALIHGVTITVVLLVLHVPLAGALGVLIFLGSFVPLVGLTVTGALAVAVSLLEHGLTSAIVVAVAIIVLVQVEGHVLQPLVMSRSVEVHPLAIALSVITGTILAGIVGALLAVPFVAFVNSTFHALRSPPVVPPVVPPAELPAELLAAGDPTADEPASGDGPAAG